MKYIVFNKKDNKVLHILKKKPISVSGNLDIAQCDNIIATPKHGHLVVKNLKNIIEEYTVPVEVVDEKTQEVKTVEVIKHKEYKTCELEAVEHPHKETLIAKEKAKLYENTVSTFIRLKYSINAELSILRQRHTKPDEYDEYNTYAEACKAKAKQLLGLS